MRILVWLIRAFLFFTLFAFALNNSHDVVVRWFFGHDWRAPLVIVVLVAFGLGCALGVLAMVPAWWKHRRIAQRAAPPAEPDTPAAAAASSAAAAPVVVTPPDVVPTSSARYDGI